MSPSQTEEKWTKWKLPYRVKLEKALNKRKNSSQGRKREKKGDVTLSAADAE